MRPVTTGTDELGERVDETSRGGGYAHHLHDRCATSVHDQGIASTSAPSQKKRRIEGMCEWWYNSVSSNYVSRGRDASRS